MEKEFNELSNKIEPVYKWYIFKKEQTGAPLKEAFEEEKKDVNAVVIKPSKKITYSPEILREQINNLEKQVNNFQMQVNLFISDFKTLSTWYDNVTRLEREQNAKAIAQAKASFEEKVMAATQSEAVASRPPGMTPPSGIPTKTTEQSKNELTGVLTSSISSSSKTQEQQAQVAKAMLDTKNL
jgi:D-mannonate dehydratase